MSTVPSAERTKGGGSELVRVKASQGSVAASMYAQRRVVGPGRSAATDISPGLTGGVLVGAQPAVPGGEAAEISTGSAGSPPLPCCWRIPGASLTSCVDEHTSRDRSGIGCGGSNGSAEIDAGSALSTDSGVGDTGGVEARASRPCKWSRSGRPQRGPVLHLSPHDLAGWPSPAASRAVASSNPTSPEGQ